MMNRSTFLLLTLVFFSSCVNKYKIEGCSTIALLDGRMLFLKVPVGDNLVSIDSAEVIHGSFHMEGSVDSTVIASLYMDHQNIMPIVIENGKITITIENTRLCARGTSLNNSLYDYIKERNLIDENAFEVERMESRMIMEGKSFIEIETVMDEARQEIMQKINALNKRFIQSNYTNPLGPTIFLIACEAYNSPVMPHFLKQILDEAPACFKENYQVTSLVKAMRGFMKEDDSEILPPHYSSLIGH